MLAIALVSDRTLLRQAIQTTLGIIGWLSLTSCQNSAVLPPRVVHLEQAWEVEPGDQIAGHLVVGSLGDVSIQLGGHKLYAPFLGKLEPATQPHCVIYSTPEVPAYLFRFCGLNRPTLGFILVYPMPYFRIRLHRLLVFSLLITAASLRPAYAEALGLDFSLPTSVHRASPELTIPSPRYEPLAIPPMAISPPIQTQTQAAQLPPPPGAVPSPRILLPVIETSPTRQTTVVQPVGIPNPDPAWIFEGGADSLVARTVGSAEGTRTADGKLTPAYYGHVDPGNGVWNLGTFSYQHGAESPEDADTQQLARLQRQSQILTRKATQHGVELSLVEKLNGIDLANQAPKAALEQDGYVERLAETRQMGIEGTDAILWARTQAYLDPDTKRWNAPGLGNNIHSIRRDQARRLSAINQSLAEYEKVKMTDQPYPTLFGKLPPGNTSTLSELPSKDDPDETLFTASNLDADNISFTLNQESKSHERPKL